MSKLTDFINMEIAIFKRQKDTCELMLRNGNPGKLNISTINGNDYYYANDKERRFLGRIDSPEVKERIQHHFFNEYLSVILNNINACEKCVSNLKEYDPYAVINSFSKAYKNVPDDLIGKLGFVPNSTITGSPYAGQYREDGLRHKTASGIMVRSKSEVLIANTYTNFNVTFAYEQPLILPDGTELLPDFTLLATDHSRRIFHEHAGMMSVPEYRQNFHRKLDKYIDNGLIPFHDVFFTFEDMNGNIDFEAIYQIIQIIKDI